MVEMGPRQVEMGKDPDNIEIKNRKRVQWRRSRGARLGGPSKWSRWLRNSSQRRARLAWDPVDRRPRVEDRTGCNATIVAEITSCATARNGKKLRKSSIPPREIECPAPSPVWMGHRDGTSGHVEDRERIDREMPE